MPFVEARSGLPRGVKRTSRPDIISFSRQKTGGGKDGAQKYCMSIRIGQKVARDAHLMVGDRVKVLFDFEKQLCLIRRTVEGGFKIGAGLQKDKKGDSNGRILPGLIKWTPDSQAIFDDVFSHVIGYELFRSFIYDVTEDGLLIDMDSEQNED
jgi:hypothetical protein